MGTSQRTSLRVGDLARRGIMATSTTVDAMMIVAMLVTMLTQTKARPVQADDDDCVLASVMKALK
eukprot:2336949-Pyramimonas_sp.AAC.1